jgi:hypothetical protein
MKGKPGVKPTERDRRAYAEVLRDSLLINAFAGPFLRRYTEKGGFAANRGANLFGSHHNPAGIAVAFFAYKVLTTLCPELGRRPPSSARGAAISYPGALESNLLLAILFRDVVTRRNVDSRSRTTYPFVTNLDDDFFDGLEHAGRVRLQKINRRRLTDPLLGWVALRSLQDAKKLRRGRGSPRNGICKFWFLYSLPNMSMQAVKSCLVGVPTRRRLRDPPQISSECSGIHCHQTELHPHRPTHLYGTLKNITAPPSTGLSIISSLTSRRATRAPIAGSV